MGHWKKNQLWHNSWAKCGGQDYIYLDFTMLWPFTTVFTYMNVKEMYSVEMQNYGEICENLAHFQLNPIGFNSKNR